MKKLIRCLPFIETGDGIVTLPPPINRSIVPIVPPTHRPLVPELAVIASYGVAISYVTADAISKGVTCAKESDST